MSCVTRVVVARRRAREAVVRDPEVAQVVADERVVAVGELTRRYALRSAETMTGVPCSSVPLTIRTSLPFSR